MWEVNVRCDLIITSPSTWGSQQRVAGYSNLASNIRIDHIANQVLFYFFQINPKTKSFVN